MDSLRYDDNLLRQYLLGGLSDVQVEDFDELSIIDDEFASQLSEVENDLIDAYVQGTLSGQTRAQFEARYLTSPRRREKVVFAQSLQAFVETKAQARTAERRVIVAKQACQEVQPTAPEPVAPSTVKAVPWWRSLNLTLQWGFVTAALLMFIIGGWFMVRTLRLQGQVEQAEAERAAIQQRAKDLQAQLDQTRATNAQTAEQLQAELKRTQEKLAQLEREQQLTQQQAKTQTPRDDLNIVSADLAPQDRSSSPVIIISPTTDYVALQLELDDADYQSYRATLMTQMDDRKLWQSGKLKPYTKGQSKIVNVSLRASLLSPRGYTIVLEGIRTNGQKETVRDYSFRVVRN